MRYVPVLLAIFLGFHLQAQEMEINAFDGDFADLFGHDVAIDGEYAIVGAPLQGGFGSHNAGAAYIYQLIAGIWTYVKKLTPPSGGMPGEHFGWSVDMTGGYAIVGAINTDYYGKTDMGAAYLFAGSGTSWYHIATLRPHDGDHQDHFGNSVGISGTRAIVGSADDDDNGTSSGSAYLYEDYYGNGWIELAKVTASDAHQGDAFGTDVSISGDHAVVGAPANIGLDHKHSGAVYVFQRWGSSWSQKARLTHDDADFFDHLGESVDIYGTQLIAGAPFANNKAGKAYIFTGSGSTWVQEDTLEAADGATFDKFGFSVGITAGIAVVGAFRDDDNGEDSGSMYVFEQSGTIWNQLMKHTSSDGITGDHFGHRVDVDGDYAISGAPFHTETASDDGAAYIYGPTLSMACMTSMYLDGTISAGSYQAADHMIVDGIILSSSAVDLHSTNFIELQQGFEVNNGALFEIQLDGCQ